MNIVHVNDNDLFGKRFNGYDMLDTLNELEINSTQLVIDKKSDNLSVHGYGTEKTDELRIFNKIFQKDINMRGLINPFGKLLLKNKYFNEADIVHYHLIFNDMFSIIDFPELCRRKNTVWTIHDPWFTTGNCVHPLTCMQWKNGCKECQLSGGERANELWRLKQEIYKKLDLDIVVTSKFSLNYFKQSPLTEHFSRIHYIPFGVKMEEYNNISKEEAKSYFNIPKNNFTLAFRNSNSQLKGVKYILRMLESFPNRENISLLTLDNGELPAKIKEQYHTVELKQQTSSEIVQKFYSACDVFLMPSIAESFGLMAIETMASNRPIIVFDNTTLSEITFAPQYGIAVPFGDHETMRDSVLRLMNNPIEGITRGNLGRKLAEEYYSYKDYINKHIELYYEIYNKEQTQRFYHIEPHMTNYIIKKDVNEKFKYYLNMLSNGKAQKIVIFCAGNFGKMMCKMLKGREIIADSFSDNNIQKHGQIIEGIKCIPPDELFKEKENILIIVSKEDGNSIAEELKSKGFPYVIKHEEVSRTLLNLICPQYANAISKLNNMDCSSKQGIEIIEEINQSLSNI